MVPVPLPVPDPAKGMGTAGGPVGDPGAVLVCSPTAVAPTVVVMVSVVETLISASLIIVCKIVTICVHAVAGSGGVPEADREARVEAMLAPTVAAGVMGMDVFPFSWVIEQRCDVGKFPVRHLRCAR